MILLERCASVVSDQRHRQTCQHTVFRSVPPVHHLCTASTLGAIWTQRANVEAPAVLKSVQFLGSDG